MSGDNDATTHFAVVPHTNCPFLSLSHKLDEMCGILHVQTAELATLRETVQSYGSAQGRPAAANGAVPTNVTFDNDTATQITRRSTRQGPHPENDVRPARRRTRTSDVFNAHSTGVPGSSGSVQISCHAEPSATSQRSVQLSKAARKRPASMMTSVPEGVARNMESNSHVLTSHPIKKPKIVAEVIVTRLGEPAHSSTRQVSDASTSARSKASIAAQAKSQPKQAKKIVERGPANDIAPVILSEDDLVECMRLIDRDTYRITLDPRIRSVAVSRAFISEHFGGHRFAMRPRIVPKHPKQYTNFIFPSLSSNPHLPREPGQPGVFYRIERALCSEDWAPVHKVLVRLAINKWLYVGEYQISLSSRSMKPEEFCNLPTAIRSEFVGHISKSQEDEDVRARLAFLLKHGYEPTIEETKEAMTRKNHFTPRQIADAIKSGALTVVFWCMECVGYDQEFQRELATQFPLFEQRQNGGKAATVKVEEAA